MEPGSRSQATTPAIPPRSNKLPDVSTGPETTPAIPPRSNKLPDVSTGPETTPAIPPRSYKLPDVSTGPEMRQILPTRRRDTTKPPPPPTRPRRRIYSESTAASTRQPSTEPEAFTRQPSTEPEAFTRQPSTEPEAFTRQPSSEPEAFTRQPSTEPADPEEKTPTHRVQRSSQSLPPPSPTKQGHYSKSEQELPATALDETIPLDTKQSSKPPTSPNPKPKPRPVQYTSTTTPFASPPNESQSLPNQHQIQGSAITTSEGLLEVHQQPSIRPIPKKRRQQKLSKELTLHELVENYSKSFPVRITVVTGYFDLNTNNTISNGDVYNVHFMKHQKVVTIQDSKRHRYSIPLNSSIQFGIVYDPDSQQVGEVNPHTFTKAANIMAAKAPPKVVCATRAFKGPTKASSVIENEILILHHVQKPRLRKKKTLDIFSLTTQSEKSLTSDCEGLFSTMPSLTKLHLSQIVQHLPEAFPCQAILFLGDDLTSSMEYFPSGLHSNLVTMSKSQTETSLIASAEIDQPKGSTTASLIDIPIDDAMSIVRVRVMETSSPEDTEKLYDHTRDVYKNLDPAKIVSYKDTGSEETYATQSLFYATLQRGREREGIELHASAAVYHYMDPPARHRSMQATKSTGAVHKTMQGEQKPSPPPVQSETYSLQRHRKAPPPPPVGERAGRGVTRTGTVSDHIPFPSSRVGRTMPNSAVSTVTTKEQNPRLESRQQYDFPKQQPDKAHSRRVASNPPVGERAVTRTSTRTSTVSDHIENEPFPSSRVGRAMPNSAVSTVTTKKEHVHQPRLESRQQYDFPKQQPDKAHSRHVASNEKPQRSTLERNRLSLPSISPLYTPLQSSDVPLHSQHQDSNRVEDNKRFLLSLSVTQVQDLLEAMDLTQYKDAFATECISGDIFAELDEDVLQHELGVKSKIHRIRLMKVVTGKHSAQNILAGMDPCGSLWACI